MKLSIKGLALAGGLLWGGAILVVGLINLVSPGYGMNFLQVLGSVYPGYHAVAGFGSVVIGTICGFIDGAIAGGLLSWLYNKLI